MARIMGSSSDLVIVAISSGGVALAAVPIPVKFSLKRQGCFGRETIRAGTAGCF